MKRILGYYTVQFAAMAVTRLISQSRFKKNKYKANKLMNLRLKMGEWRPLGYLIKSASPIANNYDAITAAAFILVSNLCTKFVKCHEVIYFGSAKQSHSSFLPNESENVHAGAVLEIARMLSSKIAGWTSNHGLLQVPSNRHSSM